MNGNSTSRKKASFLKDYGLSLLFILPGMVLLLLFVIVPTIRTVETSFFVWDGVSPEKLFCGLKNYQQVWTDPKFLQSITNNLIWAVMHILFACGTGFVLAYIISRLRTGRNLFRNIFFLPNIISLPICGVIWAMIYNPQMGILNNILKTLGLESWIQSWLGDPKIAIYAISMASCWQAYGYYMTLFLAGMQNIDVSLYEASELDGAGAGAQFIHITIPGLRHVLTFVLSIAIINGLKGFSTVWVMTQGGPGSSTYLMSLYGYVKAFIEQNYGAAMVSGVTLAVMIMLITVIFNNIRDRQID